MTDTIPLIPVTDGVDNQTIQMLPETDGVDNQTIQLLPVTDGDDNQTIQSLPVTDGGDNQTIQSLTVTDGGDNQTIQSLLVTDGGDNQTIQLLPVTDGGDNQTIQSLPVTDGDYNHTIQLLPETEDGDNHTPEPIPVRCASCAGRERLLDFGDLNPGDHITLAGQNFLFNIDDKQVAFYTHHAIVNDVETVNLGTAIVTLIHFYTTPFDPDISIRETNELLDLRHHEIYKIIYRHKKNPPDVIIKRAKGLVSESKKHKYSLSKGNCEHFCNWCCIGNRTSSQVKFISSTLRVFLGGIMSIGDETAKLIIIQLLILSADDIAKVAAMTFVPWYILAGITVVLFIYTLCKDWYFSHQLSKGEICAYCCRLKKSEYWCRFLACLVYQAVGLGLLTLVTVSGDSTGAVIGVLSGLIVLTLTVICSFNKIHSIFCSPFQGKRDKVYNMDQIQKGDAIYIDHWRLSHAAIVSEVTKYDATSGRLKVFHYSLPKLFGTRMIDEDKKVINLDTDNIVRHDYSGYSTYNADEVVERAKKRRGETKFWVFGNRSCHFTHWAKVNENPIVDPANLIQNEESNKGFVFLSDDTLDDLPPPVVPINVDHSGYRKHATKTLGSVRANIRDEIHPGQIIEFKYKLKYMYFRLKHKAICTEVTFDDDAVSKLKLKVVHFNRDKLVVEDTFTFDLKYDNVWVHPIHPINRFRPDEVIRRARAKIGRSDYKLFSNRSCHLAREVVMKEDKQLAIHMDDIKPGDVAIIWGHDHYVVVTKVVSNGSTDNNKGDIHIVHYARDHVFATRTVRQEKIPVNLATDQIYIKDFHGYVTYPPELVVARAQSRVGEQRFNAISNTSAELAFWAKVVQTPAIVSHDCFGTESNDRGAIRFLLLPEVGKKRKGLQRVSAYSWGDLRPGMDIEYKYCLIKHRGLLTVVDETAERVKVIPYGIRHQFAARTNIIMVRTQSINMKTDNIMIYIADPSNNNEQMEIVRKAREQMQEQRLGFENEQDETIMLQELV